MIAIIFSYILFFLSIFFLFKQALVTAAAIMGFSLIWFIVGAWYHKFELIFTATSNKGGTNS